MASSSTGLQRIEIGWDDGTWWNMMRHDGIVRLSFLDGGTWATPFELAKGAAKDHVHHLGAAGIWPGQHWHDHTRTGRYKPELYCLIDVFHYNSKEFNAFSYFCIDCCNSCTHLITFPSWYPFQSIQHSTHNQRSIQSSETTLYSTLRSLLQKNSKDMVFVMIPQPDNAFTNFWEKHAVTMHWPIRTTNHDSIRRLSLMRMEILPLTMEIVDALSSEMEWAATAQ